MEPINKNSDLNNKKQYFKVCTKNDGHLVIKWIDVSDEMSNGKVVIYKKKKKKNVVQKILAIAQIMKPMKMWRNQI